MERVRNVAVLVYEKADTLDFAGPNQVFGLAGHLGGKFRVFTVAEKKEPIRTIGNITVVPKFSFDDCPAPDIVIVPGGPGWEEAADNDTLVSWIQSSATCAELVLSVCTGAFLLAKSQLLDGLTVTTNSRAIPLLREIAPVTATVVEDVRYVDNGKVVLAAGVTAGFDAALYIVSRLKGREMAIQVASWLEYEWREERGLLGD